MDQSQPQHSDQRHEKRVSRFIALFSYSFDTQSVEPDAKTWVEQFAGLHEQIDNLIHQAAPDWPLEQMNRVDLAILRSILLEHLTKKTPKKVLLDEAVKIAKLYGADSSPKLVNGALGKILIDSH